MFIDFKRKAREKVAGLYDDLGQHEVARRTRSGMYDKPFVNALAEHMAEAQLQRSAAERSGQIAGTLFGVFVGFIVAIILLA